MKSGYSSVIRKVLDCIKPYRGRLVLSLAAAALSVLFTIVFPLLTGRAVDAIASGNASEFSFMVAAMALSALMTSLMQYIMNRINNSMAYGISRDIRKRAFTHLQKLPLSYVDSHPHGDIVSRMAGSLRLSCSS